MVVKIFINNVEVGSIPRTQYEKIKKDTYRNKKNYILQIINFVEVVSTVIFKIMLSVAFIWFALFLIYLVYDPDQITYLITMFKEQKPEQITQSLRAMFMVGVMFSIIYLTLESVVVRSKFGYENAFKSSIEENILAIMEVPERGKVRIKID